MADFMRMKYENPKLKQSEIANQLCYFSSTLQIYKNDKNMLSPYRIQSNNTNKQAKKLQILSLTTVHNASLMLKDSKRPQKTLKQLKQLQNQIG